MKRNSATENNILKSKASNVYVFLNILLLLFTNSIKYQIMNHQTAEQEGKCRTSNALKAYRIMIAVEMRKLEKLREAGCNEGRIAESIRENTEKKQWQSA